MNLAALFRAFDEVIRVPARLRGIGRHTDPRKHFGPGGVAEAEAECERINRDLAAYLKPPESLSISNVERSAVRCPAGVVGERILFDSPLPSGVPANDRVEMRVYRSAAAAAGGSLLVFHHPVYQDNWNVWRWFLAPVIDTVPVAHLAAPYHFGRTPPGWFPGEGTINPNPVRMFEAIRQWFADERAARLVLRRQTGLEPVAVVGYSLGAFQSILAGSFGQIRLPIVSIATTSRYGWGLLHGALGRTVVTSMQRVGIDEDRLMRMVRTLELDRFASALRGHPVLFIQGRFDEVDPHPSIELLERALQPSRSVRLGAGHASVALWRRRVAREICVFLRACGLLDR